MDYCSYFIPDKALFGSYPTTDRAKELENNGVTKYFRIPLSIRSRKKHNGNLKYQKIDTPAKIFYIYTLEKEQEKIKEKK